MTDLPLVTVLIPARNEADDLARCLRAVIEQEYPIDRLEIVLVDGGSSDQTVDVAVGALTESASRWAIVDNPSGRTPSNLNAGLSAACGEVVCRVDARSVIPPDYVRTCVEVLRDRPEVAVTGGAQIAVARDDSIRARGIARALNNRFTMGGARYRSGAKSGPTDTVYLGAFRRKQLEEAGGWNEYFDTNQDYELNRRLAQAGTVWFDHRLVVGYLPRHDLRSLWNQYHRFGRWKVRYWRETGDPPQRRQVAALTAGVAAAATSVLLVRRRSPAAALLPLISIALDARGAQGAASLRVRCYAQAATVVVTGAWVSGVLRQLSVERWNRLGGV